MKIFYAIYLDAEPFKTLIDALLCVYNPEEKHASHITIRGPYSQPHSLPRADELVSNMVITVDRPGTFFSPRQNTVFFECQAEPLKQVWYKPSYPNEPIRPHITIYDGPSRETAIEIVRLTEMYPVCFEFRAETLGVLSSHRGQKQIPLREFVDWNLLSNLVDCPVDADRVSILDQQSRQVLGERIFRALSTASSCTAWPHIASQSGSIDHTVKRRTRSTDTQDWDLSLEFNP